MFINFDHFDNSICRKSMKSNNKFSMFAHESGVSLPGKYASDTPSTSMMRATPARTHLSGWNFVLSCAVKT